MKKYALLSVFLALVFADFLDISLSLAPGLSAKNALLYILVIGITLEAALQGGIFSRRPDYLPLHAAFVLLAFYAAISALSTVIFVKYPGYSAMYAIFALKGFAVDPYLMLFVFMTAVSAREANWLAKAMMISLTIACALCLLDMFGLAGLGIMEPRADGRLQGAMVSNEYGTLMAFFVPLAAGLLYASKGLARLLWVGAIGIFMLFMLFTASRGAIAGLVGGAAVATVLLRRHLNGVQVIQALVVLSAFLALALVVLTVQYGDLLYERFIRVSLERGVYDQSSGRTQVWAHALGLMADNPWTLLVGFGWKSFQMLNPFASHNEYIEYFFTAGLIGLSLALFIYSYVVAKLVAAVDHASDENAKLLMGAVYGFLAVLIASLFGNWADVWLFVWAFMALVLRIACADEAGARQRQFSMSIATSTAGSERVS